MTTELCMLVWSVVLGLVQIALAAAIGGKAYLADGILPTLPVMERAIGVQSGRVTANVASLPRSETDALLARQLASHAFSATDVGDYALLDIRTLSFDSV